MEHLLQKKVIGILQARMQESVSCALGPTGSGLADVFLQVESDETTMLLDRLARTDEGRAAILKIGEVAVNAYLYDLVLDMDQGVTPLGFSLRSENQTNAVSSCGMADYWNLP